MLSTVGMQILGRTDVFTIPAPNGELVFEPGCRIDFQIASEKNMDYKWSLYSVDDENALERIHAESFSIKDYYGKYDKEPVKTGYDLEVSLKYFKLAFKLFIQNSPLSDLAHGADS